MGSRQKTTSSLVLDDVLNRKILEAEFIDLRAEPLAKVIEKFLSDGGLDPEKILTLDDNLLRFNSTLHEQMSLCVGLYTDPVGDVCTFIDVAVARLQKRSQFSDVHRKLSELNSKVSVPIRYLLDEDKMIVRLSFVTENPYTSAEAFKNILDNIPQLSVCLLEILVQHYSLEPFYSKEKIVA